MPDATIWWTDSHGRIELQVTLAQAESCFHPGPCDADVARLRADAAIAAQLQALDPQRVAACLREYGAWSDEDLTQRDDNLSRLLWIACCDVAEEPERWADDADIATDDTRV